jgi:diguanylate cyclase (GGDEF)-like protein
MTVEPTGLPAYGGLTPRLFERLSEHLAESVVVVDAEGRVRSRLGPPTGALGVSAVIGRHIFEYLVPDDLPRSLELAVEALGSSPGWFSIWNVPLRDADGTIRDFEIRIVNCQDDPEIDGFVLRLRELPSRGEATTPLFASELGSELETLAGAMPLPILLIGSDSRLYYANDSAREICAEHLAAMYERGIGVLAHDADREALEASVRALLTGPGERTVLFRHRDDGDAAPRMIEAHMSGLGRENSVLALVVTIVDVTVRHLTESELRRQAISDPLTGLANRAAIETCLQLRLERPDLSVGICYLDLDGFKSVNDTHGHEVGDEVLIAIADAVRSEIRPTDEVGRFGGDEFIVVAEVGDAMALGELATRVGEAVARRASALGHAVTASVGTALTVPGDTPRDLIRRADQSMYEVKRINRVTADPDLLF